MTATRVHSSDKALELFNAYDTFLLDCDGVLWHGNQLIPEIKETLEMMRSHHKRILFVTNNSTKSRKSYLKKFQQLNIHATLDEIFGSSYAAAYHLKHSNFDRSKKVYVIGQSGITDELEEEGILWCGSHFDNISFEEHEWDSLQVTPDPQVGAVLVGFDLQFNYKKLAKAHSYITYNPSCFFYATNADAMFPTGKNFLPGTGAIVSAVATATSKEPLIFGKPHQTMLDCIVEKCHLDRQRTCMVGDRLDTDIAFGALGGLGTLLVMSGVTLEQDLVRSTIQPDYVASNLAVFLKAFNP